MSQGSRPLVSIVTPCRNSAPTVAAAVESVLSQGQARFEHIVVDGASTDGTLDVLSRYGHLRVLSEPDAGLYDALNKGIALARGELVGWLNADDMYADGALPALVQAFQDDPGLELACGDALVIEKAGEAWNALHWHPFSPSERLGRGEIAHGGALLNACLFARALLDRVGRFDDSYRISGDKDYLIRLALQRPAVRSVGKVTYLYRSHGGSLTLAGRGFDAIRQLQGQERLRLYSGYLHRGPPPGVRAYCRDRYREEVLALSQHLLRARAFGASLRLLRRALGDDPLSLAWLGPRLAWRLLTFRQRGRAGTAESAVSNPAGGPLR